jgi:hypothetical protein
MAKARRKPWFRMWDELLTDPKMLSLSNAQVGMWCKLLCFANQQTVRGIISFEPGTFDRTFEKVLNSRRNISKTALKKFQELGMINIDLEEGYVTIINWNKRQFASDDVTERTKKFQDSKRLRNLPEQNRTEGVSKHLRSGSISSYSIDQGDQTDASLEAALSGPPFTEKDASKEKGPLSYNVTEDMIDRFLSKNGEQELSNLLECAKGCLDNGQDKQVNAALWHTVSFYESKGGVISAKVYFRQELKERLGSLNAVAEAG